MSSDDYLNDEVEGNENIYDDDGVQELVDEDAIDAKEAGIMHGVIHGSKAVKCSMCKKIIDDPNYAYELEYEDELYLFDTEECRDKFKKKHNIKDDEEEFD